MSLRRPLLVDHDGRRYERQSTIVEHVAVAGGRTAAAPPLQVVAPGYFETMGNRLVAGRAITWTDIYQASPSSSSPRTWRASTGATPRTRSANASRQPRRSPWREIVGVVGNEHDDGLNQAGTAIVYWPIADRSSSWTGRFL